MDIGQENILIVTASITSAAFGKLISRTCKSRARSNKACATSGEQRVDSIEDRAAISCYTNWCQRQVDKVEGVFIDRVDIVNTDGPVIKEPASCAAEIREVIEADIITNRCWQFEVWINNVSAALSKSSLCLLLVKNTLWDGCLLYTSPSPRDQRGSRMPSSA